MMKRKEFIKNNLLAGGALISGATITNSSLYNDSNRVDLKDEVPSEPFTMKFSPDFHIFNKRSGFHIFSSDDKDYTDQIKRGYDLGFRAWEHTMLRDRSIVEQEQISSTLAQLGMEFGQFVGTMSFDEVTFAGRDEEIREKVLKEARESVEIAKRMNTKYVHNVLGRADPNLQWDFQMANATELLKRMVDIYEPHGLIMVMETMNHKINHAGMFLHTIPQAYALAKAADSPSIKILFDTYHVQIEEGNIIPTLDYAWDEIGYIQIADTPGRNEPGTGEINFKNLLQHIHDKGYRGFVGLEHGITGTGEQGDLDALASYRHIDPI